MIYGIDISEWQPNMIWSQVTQDFVVVRSSYGIMHADYLAPLSRVNARRNRKAVAHYHYALPAQSDPVLQADVFLSASDWQIGEPLALDVEENDPNLVQWCLSFAQYIKVQTRKPPLIYTNLDFIQRYDWTPLVQLDSGLWLAHPDGDPHVTEQIGPWPFAAMKQYETVYDAGAGGAVDHDSFMGDVATFRKYGP